MATKVKLRVIGLNYSQTQTGSYALVLAEENGRRRIPIMIGAFEAQAIALHLEDLQPPRPLTHDLFRRFSMAFGIELKEVFINKLSEGIFYSELLFDREGEMARIDSRTSDAVALAPVINALFTLRLKSWSRLGLSWRTRPICSIRKWRLIRQLNLPD
jgi:bifunctional DNase/RNase